MLSWFDVTIAECKKNIKDLKDKSEQVAVEKDERKSNYNKVVNDINK